MKFEIRDTFYLDNQQMQIISGSIHYFRVVPEYWRDRLEKLKAMGCNTVETYIPWNLHEPQKGTFRIWDCMSSCGPRPTYARSGSWEDCRPGCWRRMGCGSGRPIRHFRSTLRTIIMC